MIIIGLIIKYMKRKRQNKRVQISNKGIRKRNYSTASISQHASFVSIFVLRKIKTSAKAMDLCVSSLNERLKKIKKKKKKKNHLFDTVVKYKIKDEIIFM